MEMVWDYLQQVLDFVRAGYTEVNAAMGLIISVIAAFLMSGYSRIVHMTIGATIAHVVIALLIPVIADGEEFVLPPLLEARFWQDVGLLAVGYLVVISVFYLIRRVLLRR